MKKNHWLSMRLGKLGGSTVHIGRKWRWAIEFLKGEEKLVEAEFVKVSHRPDGSKRLTVTYYDLVPDAFKIENKNLWEGDANQYSASLKLYGGCGEILEEHTLFDVSILGVQESLFGDDFVEISFSYENIAYKSFMHGSEAT